MNVVSGSMNVPKVKAIEVAFTKMYPGQDVNVESVSAESRVSSHPTSARESIEGAINRAQNARELRAGADYYVGIEGGLLQAHERAWELGWVAVENSDGAVSTGISSGLELKGEILDRVLDGEELSEVLEEKYAVPGIGEKNGFYGLTTNDLVTRESAYVEAIIFAMAQFNNPQYFE